MSDAEGLFCQAMSWLRDHYAEYVFYTERDVVWTVQGRLRDQIEASSLPLHVHNDHPVLRGARRSRSADLVILGRRGEIEVAAEFKYEPSHARTDILRAKLPVVSWGKDGIRKDHLRIREFVERGGVRVAYSIFIDEGGRFRDKALYEGTWWDEWKAAGSTSESVFVLWSKAPPDRSTPRDTE